MSVCRTCWVWNTDLYDYALKFAKAAPAIAMSYLSVVWGLLGGYFFFHEVSTQLVQLLDLQLLHLFSNATCAVVCFCTKPACLVCEPHACDRGAPVLFVMHVMPET